MGRGPRDLPAGAPLQVTPSRARRRAARPAPAVAPAPGSPLACVPTRMRCSEGAESLCCARTPRSAGARSHQPPGLQVAQEPELRRA